MCLTKKVNKYSWTFLNPLQCVHEVYMFICNVTEETLAVGCYATVRRWLK